MRRLLLLLPLTLAFAGCSSGPESGPTATLVLHQATLPSAVTKEQLTIKDAGGSVVFGPSSLKLEATNTLSGVPVSGTTVEVEAYVGEDVSGSFSQAVALTAGATVEIDVTLESKDPTIAELAFVNPPTEVKAGAEFAITLRATDRFGLPVAGGQATLSVSEGLYSNGQLVDHVAVPLTNGEGTVSKLAIRTAGASLALHAVSGTAKKDLTLKVTPGDVAAALAVETPLSRSAGIPFDIRVTVVDAYGNVKTDASEPVSLDLAQNEVGAVLKHSMATAVPENGVAKFVDCSIEVAAQGLQLQATSGEVTGMSYSFTVTPGWLDSLVFVAPPGDFQAGATFSVQVLGLDMFGNVLDNGPTVTLETLGMPFFVNGQQQTSLTATIESGAATFSDLTVHEAGGLELKATSDTFTVAHTFTVVP